MDIKITPKAARKSQNNLKGVVSEALFSGNVMKISVELGSGDFIKVECPPKLNSFEIGIEVNTETEMISSFLKQNSKKNKSKLDF